MKKIFCLLLMGSILFSASAWGDEVDEGLREKASLQVQHSAKQMVQAGVPGDEAAAMTQRMMENRFQEEQVIRAHHTIKSALQENLPAKPVMDKAYEGMVKNVPPEMVLQAMEKTRSRYAHAYRMAREITPEQRQVRTIGNAIAEGFSAGITEGDVDRVMERLQTRLRQKTADQPEELAAETFLAVRTMARLGVSSQAAADVVRLALENRFNAREMNMLQLSFKNGSLQTDPEMLAHRYAGAISRGERGKGLERSMEGDLGRDAERGGTPGSGQSGAGGADESGASGSGDSGSGSGSGSGGSGGSSGSGGGSGGR